MKILNTSTQISKRFESLFSSYEKFACLSAWGSSGKGADHFYFYKMLRHQKERIDKMVIGTHMYQTEPNFIEEFIDHPGVRFHKPKGALFHPKLYLFFTPSSSEKTKWSLLIGSANLTSAAFSRNKEILLETNYNEGGEDFFSQIYQTIEGHWEESTDFDQAYFENYKALYPSQQGKIRSLTGEYEKELSKNKNQQGKDILDISVCMMIWKEFVQKVKKDTIHPLKERLRVLKKAKGLFASVNSFSELSTDDRKFIAGLPCSDKEAGIFGSMKGAGFFHQAINDNDPKIVEAIDSIPLHGDVEKEHFNKFIQNFSKENWIATATRLLAMKRPDIFVCVDSKNRKNLCHDFAIKSSKSYEWYWESIVARIKDSQWWNAAEPRDEIEKEIWRGRAAFLDSLYYEES